jgi:hypothetical protein
VNLEREPPDGVKRDRREALDAGIEAYLTAAAGGDTEGAARILDELKARELLVPDEHGVLQPGPGTAD